MELASGRIFLSTLLQAPRNGGQVGGRHGARLVWDPHCARYIGLSKDLAGGPAGASRRGRGISPVPAMAWLGEMELLRIESPSPPRSNFIWAFLGDTGPFYIFNLPLLKRMLNNIKRGILYGGECRCAGAVRPPWKFD